MLKVVDIGIKCGMSNLICEKREKKRKIFFPTIIIKRSQHQQQEEENGKIQILVKMLFINP